MLFFFRKTEYVLVSNTNLLILDPEYKDMILKAKESTHEGFINIFVNKEDKTNKRYGYVIEKEDENVLNYVEKTNQEIFGEVYKKL